MFWQWAMWWWPWLGPVPMMGVELDSALASDCAHIHGASFAHPWSETEFERLLSAENSVGDGLRAGEQGPLAGFVLSRRAADEAEILTISVNPAWRRRGVGAALLDSHIRRLPYLGVKTLFLEVAEDNAGARALYRKHGFEEKGVRKAYYPRRGAPATNALTLSRSVG